MTKFAWKNYKQYAWGRNELKPMSRSGHQAGIFGGASNAGATIIDAVDTLHIMGLEDEVKDAQEWIFKQFSLNTNSELSAFEVNIRFVGGLLAIYTLTKEKVSYIYKTEAVQTSALRIICEPWKMVHWFT
jgi:mannosyl-oligosaccharide alpha-1,2-mannosidase